MVEWVVILVAGFFGLIALLIIGVLLVSGCWFGYRSFRNALRERRVRLGLLLADVGQKAEVDVSDAEMQQAVMNQARQYPGQEREFFEFVQNNANMRQQLRAPIFEDKVIDHIVAGANVTEKEVTKEDLEKAIESLDEE